MNVAIKLCLLFAFSLTQLFSYAQTAIDFPTDNWPLVVFMVRHAEKADHSRNPKLSKKGKERARALAQVLKNANIDQIHSSDFIRTKNTAEPIAQFLDKKTQIYNPKRLDALVTKLKDAGGRHLVVGHSNSTPNLVELLGGDPVSEIDEKSEYDRLYMVTITKDGTVSSVLLRYGIPFKR
jgi:phosphohistidine phosphatase SixA